MYTIYGQGVKPNTVRNSKKSDMVRQWKELQNNFPTLERIKLNLKK